MPAWSLGRILNFDYRSIVQDSVKAASLGSWSADEVVLRLAQQLKRKAQRHRVPLSIILPGDDLQSLHHLAQDLNTKTPYAGQLLHRIVSSPPFAYPLGDDSSSDDRKIERVAVAGVFDSTALPSGSISMIVELSVTNKRHGQPRQLLWSASCRPIGPGHEHDLRLFQLELERLYTARKTGIQVVHNTDPTRPHICVLVATPEVVTHARSASPGWKELITGASYVQGIELRIHSPLPTFDRIVAQHLVTGAADLLVLWPHEHGAPLAQLGATWSARRSPDTLIRIQTRSLTEFVNALREELELRNDLWEAVSRGEAAAAPTTLAELGLRLDDLAAPSFVITANARTTCVRSGYTDPARMWDHVRALAAAAAEWARKQGTVGMRLEDWISQEFGIAIALHDAKLGDHGRFLFEDVEYSRAPHVKVDDAKPYNECGRIHFAIDVGKRRVIVDHIGLHL